MKVAKYRLRSFWSLSNNSLSTNFRVVSPQAGEVLKSLLSPKSREISCSDMEIILKENVKIKWTKKWNVCGIDVAETEYLKSESDQVVRWWSSDRIVDPSRWVVVMNRVSLGCSRLWFSNSFQLVFIWSVSWMSNFCNYN